MPRHPPNKLFSSEEVLKGWLGCVVESLFFFVPVLEHSKREGFVMSHLQVILVHQLLLIKKTFLENY